MDGIWLQRVWRRETLSGKLLWLFFLLPASRVYLLAIGVRNALYALRCLSVATLPKPVISIGNLTVGGTGKTPTCLWLAGELVKRGFKVAILTRGYGRKERLPVILDGKEARGDATQERDTIAAAGDEPSMMARLYGHLVGVGADRYQTARELLSKRDVDLFLLDDGFQHRRLRRDVDCLLLGSDWQGWPLPAGPFRESMKSLRRADFFLVTGSQEKWQALLPPARARHAFVGALTAMALFGPDGDRWKEYPLSILFGSKILAVAGIADPSGFYRMIHDWGGEIVETLEFADHHGYSARDWQEMSRLSRHMDLVVTTEKDILKLARFPFARGKLLALRVAMAVENGEAMVDAVIEKLGAKSAAERAAG